MATGPLDHPSYLTRQQRGLGPFTAGAAALSNKASFPWAVLLHQPAYAVMSAGTSTANAANIICIGTFTGPNGTATTGTNTIATQTIGTAAAGASVVGADLGVTVNVGSTVYVKNGADTVGVYDTSLEFALDPVLGTWTGV